MAVITANLGLTEPSLGDIGWDATVNANFSILDAAISPWFYGTGAPGVVLGQTNNSFYLDISSENLYKRIGGIWTLIDTLGGSGATLPLGVPNLVLATNPSGSTSATVALRALVAADIPALPQSGITGLTGALALLAPLASPALTGSPTAPTQLASDNSTKVATTAFVGTALAAAVATPLIAPTPFSATATVAATVKLIAATGGSSGFTLTLQSTLMTTGQPLYAKKVDVGVGAITFVDASGATFEGDTNLILSNPGQWAIIVWSGTQWLVFGN